MMPPVPRSSRSSAGLRRLLAASLVALAACAESPGEPTGVGYEGVFRLIGNPALLEVLEAPEGEPPKERPMRPRGAGEGEFGQRTCLLARPRTVLAFQVPELPDGAVLQYGIGVRSNGYQAPGRVRVRGRLDDRPLFEHALDCSPDVPQEERRWWDHQVPLMRAGKLVVEIDYEGERAAGPFVGLADLRVARRFEHPLPASSPEAPNVALLVIDTLRADRLHTYGNPRPASPTLDALAEAGTCFEWAFASGPWTIPGTASILTGRSSPAHGLGDTSSNFLADSLDTLAEVLRRVGFTTAAFSTNPLVSPARNFDQGFERFETYRWSPGRYLTDDLRSWLDEAGARRFFLYVHYTDPHAPYVPTPESRERLSLLEDEGTFVASLKTTLDGWLAGSDEVGLEVLQEANARRLELYDGEILDVDQAIGELLAELEARGLGDRTIVCVTSDHGEEFLDHGLVGHYNQLHVESLHVPLILRGPGVPVGLRVSEPVENRWLAPTLLRLAGVAAREDLSGPSLCDPEERALAVGEGVHATMNKGRLADLARREALALGKVATLRDGEWVYLRHFGGPSWADESFAPPFERLYRVAEDPSELEDRSAHEPERVRVLRERLEGWLERERRRRPELVAPTAESWKLLRSLGYVDGPEPPEEARGEGEGGD